MGAVLSHYLRLIGVVGTGLVIASAQAQVSVSAWNGQEKDVYRFGVAYKVGAAHDATQCQIACFNDGPCKAWSYKPAEGLAPGMCELKRNPGQKMTVPGASSGLAAYLDQRFTGHRTVWKDTNAVAQGSNVPDLGGREVLSLAGAAHSNQPWPNPASSNGNGLFHIAQPFSHQLEPNLYVPSINHPGSYEVQGYHQHNHALASRQPLPQPQSQVYQLLHDSQPETRGGPVRKAEIYIPPPPQPVIPTPNSQVSNIVSQSMPLRTGYPVSMPQPFMATSSTQPVAVGYPPTPQISGFIPTPPTQVHVGPYDQYNYPRTTHVTQHAFGHSQQRAPVYANSLNIAGAGSGAPANPASPTVSNVAPSGQNQVTSRTDSTSPTATAPLGRSMPPPAEASYNYSDAYAIASHARQLPEVNMLNLMPIPQADLSPQTVPNAPVTPTAPAAYTPQISVNGAGYYPNRQPNGIAGRTDFYPNQAPNMSGMAPYGSDAYYPNEPSQYPG